MQNKKWAENQVSQEAAIEIFEKGEWKYWTPEEVVKFQLFQKRLCMSFDHFHGAIEKVLERPVYSHEFAFHDHLVDEYLRLKPQSDFGDVIGLLDPSKVLCISIDTPTKDF